MVSKNMNPSTKTQLFFTDESSSKPIDIDFLPSLYLVLNDATSQVFPRITVVVPTIHFGRACDNRSGVRPGHRLRVCCPSPYHLQATYQGGQGTLGRKCLSTKSRSRW